MQLARVLGSLVATRHDGTLDDQRLLWVQPVEEDGETKAGKPLVAVDFVGAKAGEVTLLVHGREGVLALPEPFSPADAGLVAIIDPSSLPAGVTTP